jgi:hypothetical protein
MRAKLIVGIFLGLVLGLAAGWYLGYTRPVVQANRDARKYLVDMEHDDSLMVAVALAAICDLEEQRSDKAKELLARQIGRYYVVYGPPNKPGKRISEDRMHVLRKIEEAAQNDPAVQAAIDKSKPNVLK